MYNRTKSFRGASKNTANIKTENSQYLSGQNILIFLQVIIAFTGLIYAAGILVMIAFLDRYGIREEAVEFWKVKHIHTGFLCAIYPCCVAFIYIVYKNLYRNINKEHKGNEDFELRQRQEFILRVKTIPISIISIINLIMMYILILFSRPSSLDNYQIGAKSSQFILTFSCFVFAVIIIANQLSCKISNWLMKRNEQQKRNEKKNLFMYSIPEFLIYCLPVSLKKKIYGHWAGSINASCSRWTILFRIIALMVILPFFAQFILEFVDLLIEIFSTWLAWAFSVSSVIIFIIIYFLAKRLHRGKKNKTYTLIAGVALLLPLLYFNMISFGYGIYNYIPSTRGGGDYSVSRKAIIFLKKDSPLEMTLENSFENSFETITRLNNNEEKIGKKNIEEKIERKNTYKSRLLKKCFPNDRYISKPLILILESPNGYYLANPEDAGGVKAWRRPQSQKPQLLFVPKSSVSAIEFESMRNSISVSVKVPYPKLWQNLFLLSDILDLFLDNNTVSEADKRLVDINIKVTSYPPKKGSR